MKANSDRYNLGLRLRMFEAAWEKATPARKKQALPAVQRAVFSFFAGSPAGAAAALDGARSLLHARQPTEEDAIVGTLTASAPRFLGAETRTLELVIDRFYGDRELPRGVEVEATIDGMEVGVAATGRVSITALPAKLTLTLPTPKTDFDATLTVRYLRSNQPVFVEERTLSLLVSGPLRFIKAPNPLAAEAFRLYNAILSGEQPETELPAAALRRQTLAADSAKPAWGQGQPGEFWLSLGGAPVRLLAPEAVEKRRPLPLVLALHGAGGSENLFFDGYGNGKLKALCEKHGWLLLTTRSGQGLSDLSGLRNALSALYPVDQKKVFLVGHSMGAAMACSLVEKAPAGTFAALACLGGGGKLTKKLPTFLALGEQDFGAGMARQMPLKPRIYPNAEHLTVVQDALPDVAAFFAKIAAKPMWKR